MKKEEIASTSKIPLFIYRPLCYTDFNFILTDIHMFFDRVDKIYERYCRIKQCVRQVKKVSRLDKLGDLVSHSVLHLVVF